MTTLRIRNSILLGAFALSALCITVYPAQGAIVLDQEMAQAGGTVSDDPTLNWQQSFKQAGNNITHASVNLPFTAGTVTLEVLDGLCGNVLASASADGGPGWVQVDFGALPLVPEQTYFLRAVSTQVMGMSGGNPPYARGRLHWTSTSTNVCEPFIIDYDLMFRTYTDDELSPIAVEPTTWGALKKLLK